MPQSEGKAPRGRDEIGSALRSIQGAEPTKRDSGPLASGLAADHQLLIASFRDPRQAREFQEVLLQAGIMSNLARGRRAEVSVDFTDRLAAAGALASYRVAHPERTISGLRRRFDLAIFGGLIGGALGCCIVLENDIEIWHVLAVLASTALGALMGALAEGVIEQRRLRGRLLIGMRELLIIVTLPGLFLYLWYVLKHLDRT